MQNHSFDAVIFDLDGVITKTALTHSAAWKKMFDDFLKDYALKNKIEFKEFTHKDDYLPFVDGKPRYKGVADFLESRGISLPFGEPADAPSMDTVCGLGNLKNDAFNDVLRRDGVEVYPSTVALMKELRQKGYRVGVASSSKNCEAVLEAAGLLNLVETRVDGVVSAEMGLKGKPEADIFTTAAKNLGCDYERSIVVEDAVSGVQAGRNGNFGLVLGIAREENKEELALNGADIVVEDLSEISFNDLNEWFNNGIEKDAWSISYHDYNQKKERSREALLAVGNGYFGTRGAMEESSANPVNYPGTYMASMYNRLVTKVTDRDVENEDFVNIPNWLPVQIRIDGEEWLDINKLKIVSIHRTIHFNNGLLYRKMIVEDKSGRKTEIISERFASMADNMLAGLRYSVKPLNYSGTIGLKSGINGMHINDGVDRYKSLNQHHLSPVKSGFEHDKLFVLVETTQSKHQICEAAIHTVFLNEQKLTTPPERIVETGAAYVLFNAQVSIDQTFKFEKIVSICSDKEDFVEDALTSSLNALDLSMRFEKLLNESEVKWKQLWESFDIRITGDRMSQKLLRLHTYHLLTSVSPFNERLDASITARGLHGEAYRGHIFWDELFILPLYDLHLPEVAKSMLMYRYRRLAKAREYAMEHGFKGAMFPWQSGSDGREETQVLHLNPLTGEWGDDHSSLQRHVSLAIAYNIWDYFWITDDITFLKRFGLEMFFEICRFWASKAVFNSETNRYSISGVMGPDEFHEHMPDSEAGGLKDNTYTNLMVAWMFGKANEIVKITGLNTAEKNGFTNTEIEQWQHIASNLNLVINQDGILAQYDGYFGLEELDWEYYRKKYGNVYRMDRILKAEGKSPDAYKVAKQADTLMTFYNLDKDEVDELLGKLNYQLPEDYLQRNLNYYLNRTSHGSTLSRVVHARLAAMVGDKHLSNELYQDALGSDYVDIQGGTTGEGIHAGVMAGTLLIALNTFAGINFRGKQLQLEPNLPENWKTMAFRLTFKSVNYRFELSHYNCRILADKDSNFELNGKSIKLLAGNWLEVEF
ncbi:MAG: beta-phosphoglucomutase family hydrolase [Bacteroidetes bacterium]|nr:MAG: beta-phosphoglucomutase family hydrolase [Bacteroidota bacterium]